MDFHKIWPKDSRINVDVLPRRSWRFCTKKPLANKTASLACVQGILYFEDWTGFVKRGLVKRGLVKRGLVKRGLVKRGFVKRGFVKRGLVKRGLVKRNKTISLY